LGQLQKDSQSRKQRRRRHRLYYFRQTFILELKNRKAISLPAFWEEATTEATNYAKARGLEQTPPAYVIIKRRNAGIEKAWVVENLEQWIRAQ
jgi:hypothetical protein